MRRVVQLRGANCAGKTTAMRQYIEHSGVKRQINLRTSQGNAPAIITEENVIVLGKYKDGGKFGGCDGYKNRHMLIEAIRQALQYNPNGIAFEGLIYSRTVKLAKDIDEIAKNAGYGYVGVYMHQEYEDALRKVYERNGGKLVNERVLMGLCAGARSSYEKLKRMGLDMRRIDVSEQPYEGMWKIVSLALS